MFEDEYEDGLLSARWQTCTRLRHVRCLMLVPRIICSCHNTQPVGTRDNRDNRDNDVT